MQVSKELSRLFTSHVSRVSSQVKVQLRGTMWRTVKSVSSGHPGEQESLAILRQLAVYDVIIDFNCEYVAEGQTLVA
jgi:hypothetical protein